MGGLNPASRQEMTALKRRLTEERKAALTAHWEAFASTYDFTQIKVTDKSRAVFDGPYRGVGMSVAPHLTSRQDDHLSSRKGLYPGQYVQQYRGQTMGDRQTHGQSTGIRLDKVPYGSEQTTVRTQYPRPNDARTGHQPYSNPAPMPHTPSEQNMVVQVPVRGMSTWNQEGAVLPYPPLPLLSSGCRALHHAHYVALDSSHTPQHTHCITHTAAHTPQYTHRITHTASHTLHHTHRSIHTAVHTPHHTHCITHTAAQQIGNKSLS
jgi:hypothetical protein